MPNADVLSLVIFCLGLWLDGENAALAIEMELHFATSLL